MGMRCPLESDSFTCVQLGHTGMPLSDACREYKKHCSHRNELLGIAGLDCPLKYDRFGTEEIGYCAVPMSEACMNHAGSCEYRSRKLKELDGSRK